MTTFSDRDGIKPASTDLNELIESMESVSLEEIEKGARLLSRVDTKYALPEHLIHVLLRRIRSDYSILDVDGVRVNSYTTLYFDTLGCDCYKQHHNGRRNRTKYRIRQYESTGACFLEIKSKDNKGRTDKRRMAIDHIEEELSRESIGFIQSVVKTQLDLRPRLWTRFVRITLVNLAASERATIDWAIRFRSSASYARLPGVAIAEVKQESPSRSSAVRRQLRNLSIRPMRVSKYCVGNCLVDQDLKQNRFKPKLRALAKIA